MSNMLASDEVKSMYSGVIGLSAALINPTIDQVNTVLLSQGLPPVTVVDPSVAIENADGTNTIINPWSTGKVAFLSSQTAGNTQFTLTAEEKMAGYQDPSSISTNRDIVRITRYSKTNPFAVFPVLGNPKGVFLLNTANAGTW